jgi:hypothetical protein
MCNRIAGMALVSIVAAGLSSVSSSVTAQQPTGAAIPRTADGKPNLTGLWQAMNTANWDLQTHEARMTPVVSLGAAFSVPGGVGVVDGEEIPYRPEMVAKKKENQDNYLARDPEIKCYMPGVPRAMYQPHPFQIVQSTNTVIMAFEFANSSRNIRLNYKGTSPAPSWMGWSVARWEGDTLVVDVTDQVGDTWFDRSGNFHSDEMKVTERISMIDANTLNYRATIDDPKTFTRPWTIEMPLYRRRDKGAQIVEFRCVPFVEELMWGHLRKKSN